MATFRLSSTLILALLFSAPALSQQDSLRDVKAVAIFQRSIAALGGTGTVENITDATAQAILQPTPESHARPASLIWKHNWAGSYEFKKEIQQDQDSARSVIVSGHGSPSIVVHGALIRLPEGFTVAPPIHLPALVFRTVLRDPNYKLTALGEVVLDDGRIAVQVHAELNTDNKELRESSLQDWFFDPNTWLPLRLKYLEPSIPDPTAIAPEWETVPISVDYSEFADVGLVVVPFKLSVKLWGKPLGTIALTSVKFNQGLNQNEFEPIR